MTKLPFAQISFLTSAAKLSQLPPDEGKEVAFIGRSNVGKSSAINAITAIKNLARTSKTPGRTQLLNFFSLEGKKRLVDLPGYGYAKVPAAIQAQWQETLNAYFETRKSLCGLILLIDIRHPLKEFDLTMLEWTQPMNLPVYILLTKADKLSLGSGLQTLHRVRKELTHYSDIEGVQLFSASTGVGILEARKKISSWLT
jgi:GTP-binding protein